MLSTVSSLKHLSLCKISREFDAYTPKYLLCLPTPLRYDLLSLLPVVDICLLERTHFVEGLDMTRVWDKLYTAHAKHMDIVEPWLGFEALGAIIGTPEVVERELFTSFFNEYRKHTLTKEDGCPKSKRELYFERLSTILVNSARFQGYWEINPIGRPVRNDSDDSTSSMKDDIEIAYGNRVKCTAILNSIITSEEEEKLNPCDCLPDDILNYLVAMPSELAPVQHKPLPSISSPTWKSASSLKQWPWTRAVHNGGPVYWRPLMHYEAKYRPPTSAYREACQDRQVVLKRHLHYFREGGTYLGIEELLDILVNECNYYPNHITINCGTFIANVDMLSRSQLLTDEMDGNSLPPIASLLAQFMCNLSKLTIEFSDPQKVTKLKDLICFPLLLVLSNPHPVLSSLHLRQGQHMPCSVFSRFFDSAIYLERSNILSTSLTHLEVELTSLDSSNTSLPRFLNLLVSLVSLHIRAESIALEKAPIQYFKDLFQLTTLETATLRFGNINTIDEVQEIAIGFFQTPCSHNQTLNIYISSEQMISEAKQNNVPVGFRMPYSALVYKSFLLDLRELGKYSKPHYSPFDWLFMLPELKLKSLTIDGKDDRIRSQINNDISDNHFQVRHLSINVKVDEPFLNLQQLAQNPSLETLSYLLRSNYEDLPSLTQGIYEQAQLETLVKLEIPFPENEPPETSSHCKKFRTHKIDMEQFVAFFNAVFLLPQIEQFTLILNVRWDKERKIDMKKFEALYRCWKDQAKGKRLKRLHCGWCKGVTDRIREILSQVAYKYTISVPSY